MRRHENCLLAQCVSPDPYSCMLYEYERVNFVRVRLYRTVQVYGSLYAVHGSHCTSCENYHEYGWRSSTWQVSVVADDTAVQSYH
jgi:hypothetical protein